MTTAIIGGTGFLGNAIARALLARGETVVQVGRGEMTQTAVTGATFAAADRRDEQALLDIFKTHGIDKVIDVLTLTLPDTQPLLSAIAKAGARYVMISAIDVTANYGGLSRLETPPVLARPTREDDPMRSTLYPYRQLTQRPAGIDEETIQNYDKIPIEAAAQADDRLKSLILRLPAIYGPGDRQKRFTWISGAIRSGGPINVDARTANWVQSFVYIEDAADAVARATLSDVTDAVLNIATLHHRTMGTWAEMFVDVAGTAAPISHVPPEAKGLLWERAELTDLTYPLTLDGTAFAALFGPVQQVDEQEAIQATMDWEDALAKGART